MQQMGSSLRGLAGIEVEPSHVLRRAHLSTTGAVS